MTMPAHIDPLEREWLMVRRRLFAAEMSGVGYAAAFEQYVLAERALKAARPTKRSRDWAEAAERIPLEPWGWKRGDYTEHDLARDIGADLTG